MEDCNLVINKCSRVRDKWDTLGTYLDVGRPSISSIKEDNSTAHSRLADLITVWIRREKEEDHPSWRNLCEALEKIDRGLAMDIAKEHQCNHAECEGTFKCREAHMWDVWDGSSSHLYTHSFMKAVTAATKLYT